MNSHEFRVVIKEFDAATIKASNINPAHFKAVALVLSMYGDYETGTSIKPSWLTVAREACVDRKTAMKVRDFLLSQGLLIQLSKTEANISVYKYGQLSKTEDQLSNSNEQLSNSEVQLSNIDGHNTTIDTTNNSTLNTTYKKTTIRPGKGIPKWKHTSISSSLA
jgi:CRISPR/Cas system-associated protein endoribonuclease Cas2